MRNGVLGAMGEILVKVLSKDNLKLDTTGFLEISR